MGYCFSHICVFNIRFTNFSGLQKCFSPKCQVTIVYWGITPQNDLPFCSKPRRDMYFFVGHSEQKQENVCFRPSFVFDLCLQLFTKCLRMKSKKNDVYLFFFNFEKNSKHVQQTYNFQTFSFQKNYSRKCLQN